MFEQTRSRLRQLARVGAIACPRAAARIQAKLRADSRTKRGNLPSFGRLGDVASVATASADGVTVTAAGWVHAVARKRGQVEEWRLILIEELARAALEALRGGR